MPHTGMIRDPSTSACRLVPSFGSGPALAKLPEAQRARKGTTITENPGPEVGGQGIGSR